MPSETVTTRKIHDAVKLGHKRLQAWRAARCMYVKAYAGQFYGRETAVIGNEPLNLIFNAASIIVPTLVSNFPKNVVSTKFVAYRQYAELFGMGLDYLHKKIDLRTTLRRWVVDSLFTMGIIKTGLASSNDLVMFGDNTGVDAGEPYAEIVDFDDWVIDPACRRLEEASFVGHKVRAPRQTLLDSGLFANHIVERLARVGTSTTDSDSLSDLSRGQVSADRAAELQDMVEVYELWVPAAKAIVTLPADGQVYDEFLRVEDFYGTDDGPYTYLSLTPPVPNNPLPVAPVGIWYDLHMMANRMAKKIMEQADRQKTVLGYRPAAADDAQELIDAADGEAISMQDPEGVKSYSWGGQQQSNEAHLGQLAYWFSMMSGNTDQLGGLRTGAETATGQQILQGNQSVRIEDMRDIIYHATGTISRKLAWYLHTDPLIALPLVKRQAVPPQMAQTPYGPIMVSPARSEEVQVVLTPEMRQGEFLDYNFSIEAKSMSRMDPAMKLQKALIFASRVLPSAAAAAQVCMQMGVPFSFPRFVVRMAKEMEIEWIDEVFHDPEFQMQMLMMQNMTPGFQGSKGVLAQRSPTDRMQSVGGIMGGQQQMGRGMDMDMTNPAAAEQFGAAESQSTNQGVY